MIQLFSEIIEYTHADINWVNATLKANVPIGCDGRYS